MAETKLFDMFRATLDEEGDLIINSHDVAICFAMWHNSPSLKKFIHQGEWYIGWGSFVVNLFNGTSDDRNHPLGKLTLNEIHQEKERAISQLKVEQTPAVEHFMEFGGHKFAVQVGLDKQLLISLKDAEDAFNVKIPAMGQVWLTEQEFARLLADICIRDKNSPWRQITLGEFQDALDKAKEELLKDGK